MIAPSSKFKIGDRVHATDYLGALFEAEVIGIFVGKDHIDYNIQALDRERFIRGTGFTRREDELWKCD